MSVEYEKDEHWVKTRSDDFCFSDMNEFVKRARGNAPRAAAGIKTDLYAGLAITYLTFPPVGSVFRSARITLPSL